MIKEGTQTTFPVFRRRNGAHGQYPKFLLRTVCAIHVGWDLSVCLFIYGMSIKEYKQMIFLLKASKGMAHDEIQAAYIGLWIKGYFLSTLSFCFRLST